LHQPTFKVSFGLAHDNCPFPVGSPAQRLWQNNLPSINFTDPHEGKGGFGASTAEFISVALALDQQQQRATDAWKWWETYRTFLEHTASGVDLLAQFASVDQTDSNFCVWVDPKEKKLERLDGSPPFLIVRTGQKIKTHEHLAKIGKIAPQPKLVAISHSAHAAMKAKDWQALAYALNQYQDELDSMGWLVDSSRQLLQQLRQLPGCLGGKACGALGADALLLVFAESALPGARAACRQAGLTLV
jgi:mevalonate kinase